MREVSGWKRAVRWDSCWKFESTTPGLKLAPHLTRNKRSWGSFIFFLSFLPARCERRNACSIILSLSEHTYQEMNGYSSSEPPSCCITFDFSRWKREIEHRTLVITSLKMKVLQSGGCTSAWTPQTRSQIHLCRQKKISSAGYYNFIITETTLILPSVNYIVLFYPKI